jgi:hypothetical protein
MFGVGVEAICYKWRRHMGERLRTFYLERDFYSDPQVVVVTAENRKEADKLLNEQLKKENCPPGQSGELKELDTTKPGLVILSPPGDRHLER